MDAKVGFWSTVGALVGGAAGAWTGMQIAQSRPRYRYDPEGPIGAEVEDAMVIGGVAGAAAGAFIGGSLASENKLPQLPK